VKYRGLLNQVRALKARLGPPQGVTIKIVGGLPSDWKPEPASPPGSDLHAQHRAFAGTARQGSAPERPRQAPQKPQDAPEPELAPEAKARQRGSP
jgi:hypothetical protein